MEDIYDELHDFNGKLLKELLYYNFEEVKEDLIKFVNSLHSVKKEFEIGIYSRNNFYVDYFEEDFFILSKEEFFKFLGRVIYNLYINEVIMFNSFAMQKIFKNY